LRERTSTKSVAYKIKWPGGIAPSGHFEEAWSLGPRPYSIEYLNSGIAFS
jgi:hypothetical protein